MCFPLSIKFNYQYRLLGNLALLHQLPVHFQFIPKDVAVLRKFKMILEFHKNKKKNSKFKIQNFNISYLKKAVLQRMLKINILFIHSTLEKYQRNTKE